ncbi:carbamoyltransferase HypF [Candidatus Bathyarchaeota archaeon]|nr:MAG: carbamoyltransferase HypF [Candidatus Bathyarchaeota archaeon]
MVEGIVQGVGFRPFIYRTAVNIGLKGFVRNRGDAGVEIVVEGEKEAIKQFIKTVKTKHPPLAQIYNLKVQYSEKEKRKFTDFKILKSFDEKIFSGSVIPQDVSICDECLRELRNPKNPRYNYFFITCTDCGPRFTIIEKLPYDRPNTTMKDFPMCSFCEKEYRDPLNRRFHAQTVACPVCGPKVFLTTKNGETLDFEDPIREAGKLVEEGYIVAVKGNGGFHIATSTLKSEPIIRLRKVKHRAQKPFAIMAKSLEAVKTFARVGKEEEKLLTSYIRPIVLLEKNEDYYLSEQISPGLHNIGVMLPYTGMHYMLFDKVKEPAFVMTSANPPNEPIIIDNEEAIRRLGSIVDYFLLHNRKIAQRCDDSVVRFNDGNQLIIRRSRGYAPTPIHLKSKVKKFVLGVGAEENVTGCILVDDKAFITQYIGDVEKLETLNYLKEAINHLLNLINAKIEVVACDLHPRFNTTKLAQEFSEKTGCEIIPIQHHQAHLASLMGEYGLREMIGIVCDGFGYGLDGKAWGGEILWWNGENFERLGHLQEQPMVGGDKATIYPLRMTTGILYRVKEFEEWIYKKVEHFPFKEEEIEVIFKQLKTGKTPLTTSCGRVLDAVSALLGICYERTYEGEPALKLESTALRGKDVLNLEPKIENETINTTYLLLEIFENLGKYSIEDLACSAQIYLAKSLALLAVKKAESLGVKNIGFTGGVAYNKQITQTIKEIVEKNGLKFVVHHQVPPGDGGISFGQVVAASLMLKIFS